MKLKGERMVESRQDALSKVCFLLLKPDLHTLKYRHGSKFWHRSVCMKSLPQVLTQHHFVSEVSCV